MASNDKLRDEIGELFQEFVIPQNVFLVLQRYKILTKQDIVTVESRTYSKGTSEGARLLLDILVQKADWFTTLQTVLRDESVKLWHIAEIMMHEKNQFQQQSASYQRSSRRRTRADNSDLVTLSALYIKYNKDLEHKIRELFVIKICDPVLVLRVFQMCSNTKVLTKIDCDNVKAEVNNNGPYQGAVLLFSRLVLYDTWLDVLLQTLKHDDIRLQELAEEIELCTRKLTEDYERGRSKIIHLYNLNNNVQLADNWMATDDPCIRLISQVTMDLSLLLVGRDGNGKSSTGNSILGGKPFTPTSNCSSVGVEIKQASTTVSYINVTVTEVAGLEYPDADIEGDIEDTLGQIEKTITENKNGFNAVIFVLKFDVRFTKQEKDALLMIRSIFGYNVVKDFGVVVMTNGDCFDSDVEYDKQTFEEWCQGQTGEVRDLFEDCENRCVLFNNRTKDEGKMKKQRELLFSMITGIGRLYTLDEYKKADKSQTEIVVQSKLPKVEQHKNNVMSEVWEELGKIDKYPVASCDFLELSCLLNNMEEKLLRLKKLLLKEDKNTGVLKQLFYDISVAEMRIHTKRQIVEQKLHILASSATFVICCLDQSAFDLQKLTETISLKECSIDYDGHIFSKSVSGKDKDVSGYGIDLIEICKTSSNNQQVTETLDIRDKLSRSETKGHGHDPQLKDRKLVDKVPGHAGRSKPKDDLEATKIMFEAIRKNFKHDNLNHVIYLISKYEQKFTKEEIYVIIEKVKTTYGTNEIKNHSILILTCDKGNLEAEKAQMFEDWCKEETSANQQLLKACGNRCVLLNPWPKNEGISRDGGLARPVAGSGTGNAHKNKEVGHPKAQMATWSAGSKRKNWFTGWW